MKMPVRYNIVRQLMKNPEGLTPEAVYDAIRGVYPKERTCTPKEIDMQLMSMKGAGLTEVAEASGTDGRLVLTYRITDYGTALAKQYIDKFLD